MRRIGISLIIEKLCPKEEENKVKWIDDQVNSYVDLKHSIYADENRGHLDLLNVEQEKDVRARFLEGPRSIVKLLPTPDVEVLTLVNDKKVEYAHIDAEQLIMHMLAYDHPRIHYYRAGYDDDWKPATYPNDPIRGIFLGSERCKEVHKRVKKLVDEKKLRQTPESLLFVHGQMVSERTPSLPTTSITTFKCSLSDSRGRKISFFHTPYFSKRTTQGL